MQHQQGLRPHVEQEVSDAEVGQEAVLRGKYLIVGLGTELRIGLPGMFRRDEVAQVVRALFLISRRRQHLRVEVDEFAHLAHDGRVEIEEELPFVGKEGAEVVLVEFEEGTVHVRRRQRLPVLSPPMAVVAQAKVADVCLLVDDGHGQRQRTLRRVNQAAVAVRLLVKRLTCFHKNPPLQQFREPLDGREIGGGEKRTLPRPLPVRKGSSYCFQSICFHLTTPLPPGRGQGMGLFT